MTARCPAWTPSNLLMATTEDPTPQGTSAGVAEDDHEATAAAASVAVALRVDRRCRSGT